MTEAAPGSRVAVNLQGVERADIARGQVLAPPGALAAASRVDLRLRVLAGVDAALAHNARVAVFSGTAETAGRVVVLEGDELAAGAEGWVQLRLASPLALRAGDVVVLRRPSPPSTIAGGIAVDVDPAAHRRNRPEVIAALERRRAGEHEVVRVGTQEFEADRWRALEASIVRAVGAFLRANPSRAAMPRTELRAPSGMLRRAFGAALDAVVAAGVLAPTVMPSRRPAGCRSSLPPSLRRSSACWRAWPRPRCRPRELATFKPMASTTTPGATWRSRAWRCGWRLTC